MLACMQLVTFCWDEALRLLAVWINPISSTCQRVQRDYIHQAYRRTPYWHMSYGGVLCALIVGGIMRIFGSNIPFLLQQGSLLCVMGLLTVLPLYWCRGLLRVFLGGQGVVMLTVISWPLVFSQYPYDTYLSMFSPLLPRARWWLVALWGVYTICFIVTAQWQQALPLRDLKAGEDQRMSASG